VFREPRAFLTLRSRNSFESRFGRNTPDPSRHPYINSHLLDRRSPLNPREEHWSVHTEGFKNTKKLSSRQVSGASSPGREHPPNLVPEGQPDAHKEEKDITPGLPPDLLGNCKANGNGCASGTMSPLAGGARRAPTYFSAQTYLRYQGDKFVKRFDANCYIAITRKLDTHDLSRGRTPDNQVRTALQLINQPTLVIGIESDGLFTYAEQQELAECIPNARLATIDSPEGHDAFLLQFDEVNTHILGFLKEVLPEIMERPGSEWHSVVGTEEVGGVKQDTVGEVDDITAW
jgi:homoserine O-acetyltransferase